MRPRARIANVMPSTKAKRIERKRKRISESACNRASDSALLVPERTDLPTATKQGIKTMDKKTYTVGVGSWTHMDGTPAPEITCGHAHRTEEAAERCGTKLYAAKTVRGSWQACATWHGWYVMAE